MNGWRNTLAEHTELEDYVYSNTLEECKCTFEEISAKWGTTEKGTNGGMMNPGTYFEVKKTTLAENKSIKKYVETDVCED